MKIKKMTDEKCLKTFIKLLEERVTITTGFADSESDGNYTHQFLTIECGEHRVVSHPEPLDVPLRIANSTDLKETVN